MSWGNNQARNNNCTISARWQQRTRRHGLSATLCGRTRKCHARSLSYNCARVRALAPWRENASSPCTTRPTQIAHTTDNTHDTTRSRWTVLPLHMICSLLWWIFKIYIISKIIQNNLYFNVYLKNIIVILVYTNCNKNVHMCIYGYYFVKESLVNSQYLLHIIFKCFITNI